MKIVYNITIQLSGKYNKNISETVIYENKASNLYDMPFETYKLKILKV